MKKNCIKLSLLLISVVSFGQAESADLANYVRTNNVEQLKENFSPSEITKIDLLSGLRPLHLAAKLGHVEVVKFLIDKERIMETGIYVERTEKPAMIHAIEQGNIEIINAFLENGARDVNNRWMGKTYLFHAYDLNVPQTSIDFLIKNGANEELAQKDKKQISEIAVINQKAEMLTDDLSNQISFDKYQLIDVYNVNFAVAQMIYEFSQKYADDQLAIEREELTLISYRNKKILPLLTKTQKSLFNNLYK